MSEGKPLRSPGGSDLSRELASHLPKLLVCQVASEVGPASRARAQPLAGALCFADISGFTRLTERLALRGPHGAEILSEILNRYYGRMVELIDAAGGDVIAFAGDATLALWRAAPERPLAEVVLPAARCALDIQRELRHFDSGEGLELPMRVSIGAGALTSYELGGVGGRWLHLVAGEALAQATAADESSRPGEVVLSPQAAAALGPRAITRRLSPAATHLLSLTDAGACAPPVSPAPDVPEGLAAALRGYVPEVVAARLSEGHYAFLAEYRRVSVAFIGLPRPGGDDGASLERLQGVVRCIQEALFAFDGQVFQCVRDDKGFVVVAAFGMPPRSHEDDAVRACLAALEIRTRLEGMGQSSAVGIATGRIFCGAYGNEARRQYAIVGSAVNLAARLMQASGTDAILCDPETQRSADRSVEFADRRSLRLKGRTGTVDVAQLRGRRSPLESRGVRRLVGRQAEYALLVERVDALAKGAHPAATLIEAEAGMGKSTLAGAVCSYAESAGVRVVRGGAEPSESETPYFAFRSVVHGVLGLAATADGEAVERAARARLRDAPELVPLLPLLKVVTPIDLPDNALTQQMTGQVRADNTGKLLLGLLEAGADEQPLLVVLEDGHWMDSASWALVFLMSRSGSATSALVTTRPLDEPPVEHGKLLNLPGSAQLRLAGLEAPVIEELVARRLGVASLPRALAGLVAERSDGNPFHAEELALSLRDAGLLSIEGERCRIRSEVALAEATFPDSLQAVITGRLDRLPLPCQLTLKVASVIGRVFEAEMLRDVHPLEEIATHVREQLRQLEEADLIVAEGGVQTGRFAFRHAITHESVYALLSYAQRRSLHRAAAEQLERRHAEDPARIAPRLAHHYSEAEMPAQAVPALREAGRQALEANANREAVRFLDRALAMAGASSVRLTRNDRLDIHQSLITAHFALTDYQRLRAICHTALSEAGQRIPRGRWGIGVQLATLLGHSLRERLTGRRAAPLVDEDREARLLAMRALGGFMSALLWEGSRAEYLEAALQVFNMGAAVEPSPESGGGRLGYGMCLAMAGLLRAGEAQIRRALDESVASDESLHIIQAYVLLGSFLVTVGASEEACTWLSLARARSEELGATAWRHRAEFTFGDALICLGRYEEGGRVWARANTFALDAEPHVSGLARSLEGLCRLRLGRNTEALELFEEGVATSRDHPASGLPLFASLGRLAEGRLRSGDYAQALTAAREAEQIGRTARDVSSYYDGFHGFAGVCTVYLDACLRALERGSAPTWEEAAAARRACRALGRFARSFPAARPAFGLSEGQRQFLLGRRRGAVRCWQRAAALAAEQGQPYELGLAHYQLGLQGRGAARESALTRAAEIFERHGLTHELERCRAAHG